MRWLNWWWYLGARVGVKGTIFNVIFVVVKQGIVCSMLNRHTCIIDAYDMEWNWQVFGLKLLSMGEIFNKYNIVLFVLILFSFDGLVGICVNILAMLYVLHFCSFNLSVWMGMLIWEVGSVPILKHKVCWWYCCGYMRYCLKSSLKIIMCIRGALLSKLSLVVSYVLLGWLVDDKGK